MVRSHFDYKFFCTNLKEDEIVTGQGNRKLREAIEVLHETYDPGADGDTTLALFVIFLLGRLLWRLRQDRTGLRRAAMSA